MIAAAPAWAVWVALGLWGLAGVAGAVVVVLGRRLWRQLRPLVEPYLLLLGGGHGVQGDPATPSSAGGAGAGHETPVTELCLSPIDDSEAPLLCTLPRGHTVMHETWLLGKPVHW